MKSHSAYLLSALDKVRSRGAAAQLCVIHDSEIVLREEIGCRADSLFLLFSASKPLVTVLIYILAERGQLNLDDKVADHWPKFGQRNKSGITIRHVLQHRSGLAKSAGALDALKVWDWQTYIDKIERSWAIAAPGGRPSYQALTYGFILGEIIRRVAGRTLQDVLEESILQFAGMTDTHLGVPAHLQQWTVPISGRGISGKLIGSLVNRDGARMAINPSAGISTTAKDLATFYQMLLPKGANRDKQMLNPSSIREAISPSNSGEIDLFAGKPIYWGHGFQLGGQLPDVRFTTPFGNNSSLATFGHNGSDCCIGWADQTRNVTFAYLTNRLAPGQEAARHFASVSDDILAAFS